MKNEESQEWEHDYREESGPWRPTLGDILDNIMLSNIETGDIQTSSTA
jgi:hypothetical protein